MRVGRNDLKFAREHAWIDRLNLAVMIVGVFLYRPLNLLAAPPATRPDVPFNFPAGQDMITLNAVRDHIQLYVKASANGEEIGYLLIDTGSSITTLCSDIVERLKLPPLGKRRVDGQLGKEDFEAAQLNRLEISQLAIEDIPVFVTPESSHKTRQGEVICGVLGLDIIGRVPFAIDFLQATLTLYDRARFSPPDDQPKFDLRPGDDAPVVQGSVQSYDGWFEIDSGDYSMLLSSAFVDQHPELYRGQPRLTEVFPWDTLQKQYLGKWASLDVLGRTVTPAIGSYQWGSTGMGSLAGLVGVNQLTDTRITIDLSSSRLWIERHDKINPEELAQLFNAANYHDLNGTTPLVQATFRKRADLVRLLLEKGADPNVADGNGITPLHVAAGRGDVDSTSALLKVGALVNAKTIYDDYTPLALAAEDGRLETVKLLLEAGAPIDLTTHSGRTPLFIAADANSESVLNFLLSKGAKVDERLPDGATALSAACRNGNYQTVSTLLEHGAYPNSISEWGTPLAYAAQSGSEACVKLLLSKGANVNLAGRSGRTPLMAAADSYRSGQCVRLLLEAGADRDMKDAKGRRALDYALQGGPANSLRLLMPQATTHPSSNPAQ